MCVCVCVCVCVWKTFAAAILNLFGVNFDVIESADIGGQRLSECGLLKHMWRK